LKNFSNLRGLADDKIMNLQALNASSFAGKELVPHTPFLIGSAKIQAIAFSTKTFRSFLLLF
jgi:hypothetical protein